MSESWKLPVIIIEANLLSLCFGNGAFLSFPFRQLGPGTRTRITLVMGPTRNLMRLIHPN